MSFNEMTSNNDCNLILTVGMLGASKIHYATELLKITVLDTVEEIYYISPYKQNSTLVVHNVEVENPLSCLRNRK